MSREQDDASAAPVVFDRAAQTYDETRGFPPGVERRVAQLFVEAGRLSAASRVLELGVGTGRIALPLAARGPRVAGVDLSRAMLAKLVGKRGALPLAVAHADAAQLPFPSACFDAVLGVHVFHLIPRWREVLREVARVLRPGALFLHGADAHAEQWARWRDRFGAEQRIENVGVPSEQFESFPEDEGWTPLGPVHRLQFVRTLRPQQLVDRILQRTWSMTWPLSDAQLAEAAQGLRAELAERFGDLERPARIEGGFWVRAYLPPS